MQHALRHDIDPDGLLEFSVVYTDRSLNHMSQKFKAVMTDLSANLKQVYNAHAVALVSGGGTYAMEAVARQLATNKKCLIIRNGWFSYRWTQILDTAKISDDTAVLTAQMDGNGQFAPPVIDEVVQYITQNRPEIVFVAHVETASGIMLNDGYIKALSDAIHSVGGLLVVDCIASGCIWLDMQTLGIDVLLSAPQKGWSSTPCAGVVMMSKKATQAVDNSISTSFAMDLKAWLNIMRAYENGSHAYHATMPTDSLRQFAERVQTAKDIGFEQLKSAQIALGEKTLQTLANHGFKSVAQPQYQAYGVIVCYTDNDDIHKGTAFAKQGVQIASGVPLKVGEPDHFKTFRLGLFGLDKLSDVDASVQRLDSALQLLKG